ncbi:MAG: uroporphyrinogen decarboxylase family protein, partial [Planctomycetota bacterium]
MNSKQRVLTALDHINPDRTPCNYLGTPEANEKLLRYFQTDDMDVVLEKLGTDLRIVDAPYIGPELSVWDDGRFETYWGHIRKPVRNEAGSYDEAVEYPYAEFNSIEDVTNFRWPKSQWFDYSKIVEGCEKYSDYAIVFGAPGNMDLINGTAYGRGVEKVIYDIALEDPIGLACMVKRFQCCYERTEKALQAAGGKIDILWIGDDYGTQKGLLVSPQVWRKLFFPKLKAMCDLGHKYNTKVMLHSCGSTRQIWPDLIEAGVDIYDTVQPEAADMNPAGLKKEFGDRICFHGTISTQKTLPFGTIEDI